MPKLAFNVLVSRLRSSGSERLDRPRVGLFRRPADPAGEGDIDALAAEYPPTWTGDVEWSAGLEEHEIPERDGPPYTRARVLVRVGGEPCGFATLELDRLGQLDPEARRAAIARQLERDLPGTPRGGVPPLPEVDTPPVSVVVCTRNRAESLRVALRSLLACDYPDLEVIVVDNAPTTDAASRAVAELNDARVRVLVERRPGLSRARNRGVAEARGDIIAFTDDDVIVDPLWIRALVRGFQRSPAVACVTGLVPAAELETPAQHYFEHKVGWSDDCAPRLFDLNEHQVDAPLYPYAAGTFGVGANFAVTREAFAAVGAFDEALGAGSPAKGGEDIDYFLRVVLSGYAIAYEPAAIVWHFHRRDLGALRSQLDAYGSGLSAFITKHLLSPRTVAGILRRAPAGLRRMHDIRQRGRQGGADPMHLWRSELFGFVAGPARYLRGHWAPQPRLAPAGLSGDAPVPSGAIDDGRPLKILLATASYVPDRGGTAIHTHQVAHRLAARGHEVTVVSTVPRGPFSRESNDGRVKVKRVRAWPPARDYYFAPELVRIVRQSQDDLLHCQGYHTLVAPLVMLSALSAGIPFVTTFHSGGHSSRLRRALRPAQALALRPLLRRAHQLIAVSDFEAELFARRTRLPLSRFMVIPSGVDLPQTVPEARRPSPPLILSIGRVESYKGHHRVLEALPALNRKAPGARLRVVGTGPYEGELRRLAKRLGVDQLLEIAPVPAEQREEMARLLHQAGCVAMLSEYESQGLAIQEALALGRPLLVSESSALDALRAHANVRAVGSQATSEEIAAAVLELLDSPPVEPPPLPTWDQCVTALVEVYREAIVRTR